MADRIGFECNGPIQHNEPHFRDLWLPFYSVFDVTASFTSSAASSIFSPNSSAGPCPVSLSPASSAASLTSSTDWSIFSPAFSAGPSLSQPDNLIGDTAVRHVFEKTTELSIRAGTCPSSQFTGRPHQ
jgi:hypothetical protein